MSSDGWHRLPRTVEPEHYQLTFTVDLADGSFAGEERVRVVVHEPTARIVVNAADLEIHRAEMTTEAGIALGGEVELSNEDERATIRLSGTVEPGRHTLHLTFSGVFNEKLRGIYRSTFTDHQGHEQSIAATQFEPTDARRGFPCWDEPDRKATFATTLIVDEGLTAISNTEVLETTSLGNGRIQVEFAPTMRMSTYLVAFAVGPFEVTPPLEVDGVPLRIASVPGKQHLTGFAQQIGAHSLRFFSSYFGLPYPSSKLDLIALPDFAMGAMENLGAVTFRETLLLVDPDRATRAELERVADVVAHEIAHMWFGDLVTMRWWNGIWLNEAFATFMELLSVDAFRPEWERWVSFGTSRNDAMVIDALTTTRPVEFTVERPEEAEGMFDILTYQKGAAVVRMLQRYVGEEEFRLGISAYIAEHQYSNTETSDLWDAIEKATGEPARSIMDSWIFQGGFPLVSVSLGPGGTSLVVDQHRFRYLSGDGRPVAGTGPTWRVPVLLRASVSGSVVHRRLLVDAEPATVDLGGDIDWVVVNEGGSGFYRVRYDPELRRRLAVDLGRLEPLERLGLASDTWAQVAAGEAAVAEFLELACLLSDDDDPSVWEVVLHGLVDLDRVIAVSDRPELQAFVRGLGGPALQRLGWTPRPDESERRSRLRAALVRALGVLGADPLVRSEAAAIHAAALADPASVDADVAGAAVAVLAAAGDPDDYESFLELHRSAATPQEEIRYLHALAGFEDEGLARRTLDLALSEVRVQNAAFVISLLLANRAGGAEVWEAVKQRWEELSSRLPENLHERALGGITALSTPDQAGDVRRFLEAHPIPSRERTVAQLLERLDVAVALRLREAPGLGAAFAAASAALRSRPSPPSAG